MMYRFRILYYSVVINHNDIDAVTYQSWNLMFIAIIYASIHRSGFVGYLLISIVIVH
jgi:hypothetical protein